MKKGKADIIEKEEENNDKEEPNLYEGLPEVERESWIKFHENAYKDDLKHAEKDMIEFPRWSIISGYYSMHDITKLYLGKVHNIKIIGENIHTKTLEALSKFIQDKKEKEKVIELLKKAEINFFNVIYSKDFSDIKSQRSVYFFDNIVKPYVKIMEEILSSTEEKSKKENNKNAT